MFPAVSVAVVCVILVAIVLARHRCPHHNPLCRRNRPCLACYQKLFKDA